jgi:SAM-dependent methyltransferase
LGDAIEIGCGTGGFSMAILARLAANRVLLTDISVKMLTICRKRMRQIPGLRPEAIGYATWSIQETAFKPGCFDTCFGTAVVHHVLDVAFFLRQVHRLLKPGGVAFFLEPNAPFHQALVSALAGIVATWLERSAAPTLDIARMASWIAEVHCNIVNSGDLEVLAGREDKHLFEGSRFAAMAEQAGLQAEALACGPDPTGIETIQAIMEQVGIGSDTMAALLSEWGLRQAQYFSHLAPADRAPSYLFWLRKPAAPPPRNDAPMVLWLTLGLEPAETGFDLVAEGWCVSGIAVRAVELTWNGARHRIPVWLPRPDVQQALNANGRFPALHALCSGISGRLSAGPAAGTGLEVAVVALCTDGTAIERGTVTIRHGEGSVTVR